MRAAPQIRLLPDGRRLHLQDGPIDLVIEAFGERDAIIAAYAAAAHRFIGLLDDLCVELAELRAASGRRHRIFRGPVARRMEAAVHPFARGTFITPMAAVAGAVADEVLAAMRAAADLDKAYVNNGGDIALHLAPGASFRIGLVDRPDRPSLFGTSEVAEASPVRGMATSGRHGRSFSLGIADAVTILAANAAAADAAATIVANAVDLPGHPAVRRAPADTLQPDSDLGARLVTRHVDALAASEVATALECGVACAERLHVAGAIEAAALHLMGETRVCGHDRAMRPAMMTQRTDREALRNENREREAHVG